MYRLEAAGEDLRGLVRAWDWFNGMGYQQANCKNGGVFDGCGFGYLLGPEFKLPLRKTKAVSLATALDERPVLAETPRPTPPPPPPVQPQQGQLQWE